MTSPSEGNKQPKIIYSITESGENVKRYVVRSIKRILNGELKFDKIYGY